MEDIDIRDAFFDQVYEAARCDKDIIFITADADAFSLKKFKADLPQQFINIGVAEQNMIAVAAGLALSKKRVFVYGIIPFLTLRCYEHIKVNICSMNLPVVIVGGGAGLSFGNDGPTHHAINDIAVMRTLPELSIFNPCDSFSAFHSVNFSLQQRRPAYVRLDKGAFPCLYDGEDDLAQGFKILKKTARINIVSTGFMTHEALKCAGELSKKGLEAGVVDLFRIKDIDKDSLLAAVEKSEMIVTYEENCLTGGIGSMISEIIADCQKKISLLRIAIADKQCFDYGSRAWLHHHYAIDAKAACDKILKRVNA